MLQLLKSYEIEPICIFDGRGIPGKESCLEKRSIDKAKNREMAKHYESIGEVEQAKKYFRRCLSLKGNQIDLFQEILDLLNIQYFVAPYEADAQMAYMVRKDYAQFAISEDSDLLPFGCPEILTKLN